MGSNENIFDFLKSTRFWAAVLASGATAILMVDQMLIPLWLVVFAHFSQLLAAAFITIKTVDRVTDKATKK